MQILYEMLLYDTVILNMSVVWTFGVNSDKFNVESNQYIINSKTKLKFLQFIAGSRNFVRLGFGLMTTWLWV
jgi:hypothetical protein